MSTASATANSERLRAAAAPALERALTMRFVREATDGTLDERTLARYLSIEAEFVTVACRALGSAILRAPDLAAISGHAATMASFINDQHAYFDEADDAGLVHAPGPNALAQAARLGERVLEICDRGSYAEIVCCMFPSEVLYEVWCARAAEVDVPRSAALQEWIVSHSRPPYTDTVSFLTGQVDALHLDDEDVERLGAMVGEILDLECAFHDAAYLED